MTDHVFISYSEKDGLDIATKLADELEGSHPYINVWFDKRDLKPGLDWDAQVPAAIRGCKCLVFVVTEDSTVEGCPCKDEWTWGLKYKRPIIPLSLHAHAELPFRLSSRQAIDFSTDNFEAGVAKLRKHLAYLDSEEGKLDELKFRLADANRDLKHARPENKARIQVDVDDLLTQISAQEKVAKNPEAAKKQTEQNIQNGLERERKPEKPTAAQASTKFINPPPGIAPNYFQDRLSETRQVVDFLNDSSQRLMTVIGRGGIGKTAMVCRLLKGIENGQLPDNLGEMKAEGIVYLSEAGSHRANFANIFYDLCKLLPSQKAQELDAVYKNPQASTESKMRTLLDQFTNGKIVILLDNIETLINVETFDISDAELIESLHAFLHGAHTAVKIIMTTRIAPRGLNLFEPGRQRIYHLEEGLPSPYAEKMLRELDVDGTLGLRDAKDELLDRARIKTRGFPKGLEALKQILSSDRYTTLEELLAMPTPENVVEALVGEAFNRLDPNAQKVMQALAVYNRPVTPAAVDYLLAPHLPAIDSAPILQRLANMHFARKESGRFYLHPVDRDFAFNLIPDDERGKTKDEIDDFTDYESRFTRHDLLTLAADYFAAARKPRAEWKKLEDLSAQLAEFDLRCAAGDFDTATSVLVDFDFDFLLLWGHYRLIIQLHEKVSEKIGDPLLRIKNLNGLGVAYRHLGDTRNSITYFEQGIPAAQDANNRSWEGAFLGNLGNAYADLGNASEAIEYYQKALVIDRKIGYRRGESADLGNLGGVYAYKGDIHKAIECFEQASIIDREIGNRQGEGIHLGNLGAAYTMLGNAQKAIEYYEQALVIDREVGYRNGEEIRLINLAEVFSMNGQFPQAIESAKQGLSIALEMGIPATFEYGNLSQVYLFIGQLDDALINAKEAQKFDEPTNNYNVSTLHGIIALRQGDEEVAARGAFLRAIGQADEILSKTAEYYSALDARGLALCGLALCDLRLAIERQEELLAEAAKTFKRAREIAPHAGVVKSVLRLFDELVKCDEAGVLKDVRKAVEGS